MLSSTDHLPKPLPRRRQNPWLRRTLIVATVVALVDALVGESGLRAAMHARAEYAEATARLALLQETNAAQRELARRLADDPRTVEAVAREELGLIRPGEMLFLLKAVR